MPSATLSTDLSFRRLVRLPRTIPRPLRPAPRPVGIGRAPCRPPLATLLVEVTSGTVDVYDASLDNSSGDFVVTPIAPVPATLPSSASIGPAGGSIRSADGRLTLKVPAGALTAPATLSIAPIANTAPNAIGSAYALSPVGVAFARPAQLLLAYSNADLAGTAAGALGLASQEGSSWFAILGGSVDPVTRTLRVPVTST